jgi:hypothetical protein
MKDFIVVFHPNGARIYKGPEAIAFYQDDPNALLNPKIPDGVPPHLWALEDGKIVVRQEPKFPLPTPPKARHWVAYLPYLAVFATGFLLGMLV